MKKGGSARVEKRRNKTRRDEMRRDERKPEATQRNAKCIGEAIREAKEQQRRKERK